LVVPASNPSIGVYSSSGFTYAAPAAAVVFFAVDANSAQPTSGGIPDCMPSEQIMLKDINNQSLEVTAGTTTNVARIDFSGCT